MTPPLEQHWMQRARVLTQALIISGTLNIGLLSTFIYFTLKEKQAVVSLEIQSGSPSSKRSLTNEQVLRTYMHASFGDLILELENRELLEDGYTKRDLALASLAAFHHFPLNRILGESLLQKRRIAFQGASLHEILEIAAFPGLKDEHFEAILHFARTEKWPLTPKGMFLIFQKSSSPYDPTLLETFYMTSEFHVFQMLVQKGVPSVEKSVLVELLKAGSWDFLRDLTERLRLLQECDLETSREVLKAYAFNFQSKIALRLLLQHHMDYVIKRFNDEQILHLFDLDLEETSLLTVMAKELLLTPRADLVRQKAASFLYGLGKEMMPQPYDHRLVVQRFFPERRIDPSPENLPTPAAVPVQVQKVVSAPTLPSLRTHKVQERDSLWKIARKYGTTVEAIMKLNQLESDRLRVGKTLQIPESF